MQLTPIGVIHSPYKQRGDAPRQGRLSDNEITLEIYPQFVAALKDVVRCSHLIVLYWGDRANRETLQSRTPFSEIPVGVFSSRSPNRPIFMTGCNAANPNKTATASVTDLLGRAVAVPTEVSRLAQQDLIILHRAWPRWGGSNARSRFDEA